MFVYQKFYSGKWPLSIHVHVKCFAVCKQQPNLMPLNDTVRTAYRVFPRPTSGVQGSRPKPQKPLWFNLNHDSIYSNVSSISNIQIH